MTTLDQWHNSGAYFQINGHEIFYRTQGDDKKPCLLLIHGFPTCSWDWEKISAQLEQHFYLVTLDMLGFGFSDKPKQDYSIFEQADIYQALLNKLNINSFHILAHDYGDTVAQELLARAENQPRILSLIFSNGGLFPETHHPVFVQKLLLSPLGFIIGKLMSFNKFKNNFDYMLEHKNGVGVIHKLIHYMTQRKQNRQRWVGAMQSTAIPLHLVDGTLDPISGEHMVKRYEKLIPNASVTRLNDTGHYPQVESPQAFYEACETFWKGVNAL